MTDRERLIELKTKFVESFECGDCTPANDKCRKCLTEKEADYLLANGVIVPPCKVGDTIHQVIGCFMAKYKVTQIRFDDIMMWFYCENKEYVKEQEHFLFDETRIGRTVFLTREEAEKALAERSVS